MLIREIRLLVVDLHMIIFLGMVSLRPIILFRKKMLTTSTGKQLNLSVPPIIIFLRFLLTSSKNSDDLSIVFQHDPAEKLMEFREKKRMVIQELKFTLGFFEKYIRISRTPEKATFGLQFTTPLKRSNIANLVLHALGDAHAADVLRRDLSWYIPRYTLKTPQQISIGDHFDSRAPIKISSFERSVSVRSIVAENFGFLI